MYNDFFGQNEPSTGYKYLDSPTSGKPSENSLSVITEQWFLKVATEMNSFSFFFLNIQSYLSFPEKTRF